MSRSLDCSPLCNPTPSKLSAWLAPLAYFLGRKGVLPGYFGEITVTGQENLPQAGPVLLAPTHRSRWDSLLLAGVSHQLTGRYLRFMVTADECFGIQGWFIKRLGGFPVNTRRPAIATLRHGVKLLQEREMLVIFPEGDIFRGRQVAPLKPGMARIALQAEANCTNLGVKIVPISFHYEHPYPRWGCDVEIRIGRPMAVRDYLSAADQPIDMKKQARCLTAALTGQLTDLSQTSVNASARSLLA